MVPLRPLSRGRKSKPRVLAMRFCSHPSYDARHSQKRRRKPTFVRCSGRGKGRMHQDRRRRTQHERNEKKYKEAERRQTRRQLLHPPAQRALCKARSPVGVPLWLLPEGQLVPKALRQATLRVTVRSARSGTAAPTGGRRPCAVPRALPAPSCAPSCEHLTCRSLCRQVDARRRPSAEGTNPLPASTTPAPASYSSPAGVLVRRASGGFLVLVSDFVKTLSRQKGRRLILRRFLSRRRCGRDECGARNSCESSESSFRSRIGLRVEQRAIARLRCHSGGNESRAESRAS